MNKLQTALFAGATAAFLAAPAHAVVVVVTPATPISIPNNIDGVYLNVVTGASGASAAAAPGWDVNPYFNTAGLTFYGSDTPAGVLATGVAGTTAVAQVVAPGGTVSPTPAVGFYNQFQTQGTAFQARAPTTWASSS